MKKIILFISVIFLSSDLTSQDSFTLNEAIEFGLINNSLSKNATNDLKIANAKKWETIATGLPQINSFIEYSNNIKQPISLVPAEFFGGNQGEFAELSFGTKQTIDGSITLTQLLFDGSYSVGLASIKLYMDIANQAKVKTDQEVKKTIYNFFQNKTELVKSVANYMFKSISEGVTEIKKSSEDPISEIYEINLFLNSLLLSVIKF